MGAKAALAVIRPGYVPQGGGVIELSVTPLSAPLAPLDFPEQGRVKRVTGAALASHLAAGGVAPRMAERLTAQLARRGFAAHIDIMEDATAPQKGAALCAVAETTTGALLGADRAGKPGRRSEAVADFVARTLCEDLATGATADRHLADQLIVLCALAGGRSRYRIPAATGHVESNAALARRFLGARVAVAGGLAEIEGAAFSRRTSPRAAKGGPS